MKKVYVLFMMLLLAGCASTATIEQGFQSVDYSDGIGGVEAKRIAQKFLLNHPDAAKHYVISAAELDTGVFASFPEWKDKAWVVGFPGKSLNVFNKYTGKSFVVGVDRTTGRVLFYQDGYYPGGIPFELGGFGPEGVAVE